jgi:hypothetical protein
MQCLVSTLLRLFKIRKGASNIIDLVINLGLSFGGALLIAEAKSGRLSKRNVFISMRFLALCHSLVEDTLLILLLGAHISVFLWARLVFLYLLLLYFKTLKDSSRIDFDFFQT